MKECICRHCGMKYMELKSRADFKGYCSMKCQHAKAKEIGYRKGTARSEYEVLRDYGAIGSQYASGI